MEIRPYDPEDREDVADLWDCKQAFERGLGAGTGGEQKAETYDAKLTDEYRSDWLAWVDRCLADDERCVTVADDGTGVVGYVFVLPETFRFVWDAAVLKEIFVTSAYRGEGVADDLLDAALSVAQDQDLPLDRIVLDVDPDNIRARRFYSRYGFDQWGELVAREL